jgi:hypothetical protein
MSYKNRKITRHYGLDQVSGGDLLNERRAQLLKKIKDTDPELLTPELEQEIADASNISNLKTIKSILNLERVPRSKGKPVPRTTKKNYFKLIFTRMKG